MSLGDYLHAAGEAAGFARDLEELEDLIRREHARVLRRPADGPDVFTPPEELVRELAEEAERAEMLWEPPSELCAMCAERLDDADAEWSRRRDALEQLADVDPMPGEDAYELAVRVSRAARRALEGEDPRDREAPA